MMKRVLLVAGVAVVALIAVLSYAFFKTPEEASSPIAPIPLAQATATAGTAAETEAEPVVETSDSEQAGETSAAQPVLFEIAPTSSGAKLKRNQYKSTCNNMNAAIGSGGNESSPS